MRAAIEDIAPKAGSGAALYVADQDLRVVYTNDQWRDFALANDGMELVGPEWNTNLLDNMSGKEKERWSSIYRLLLDGELSHYEEDFLCSSPDERRIYRMRSTPVTAEDGSTLLVHHTVRVDDKPEEREAMRRRLKDLELDPEEVAREYARYVLEPRVEVPGFRVAQVVEPLDGVGGDVLWHKRYDNGTTDVLLADAMGHGLEAGVHAVKMVTMLEALAGPYREPQDILASLNRGMLRHRAEHESAFASGILFRFQDGSPRVRCTNFGHTPPIFSRSGEVTLEVGMALGIVDTLPVWSETELDLTDHGTRFLAFSDGITEQFDARGELYGTERLIQAFGGGLDLELDAMVEHIVQDVTAFRGDALVKDDLTLIAFQLAP